MTHSSRPRLRTLLPLLLGLTACAVQPVEDEPEPDAGVIEPEPEPEPEPFAQTWDLTESFPGDTNPSGPWTYGYASSFRGALVEHPRTRDVDGILIWDDPANNDSGVPSVWQNTTGALLYGNPDGMVALHPGLRGEPAVARFTAPVAATYAADIQAFVGDSGPTEVAVTVNGAVVFPFTSTADDPAFILQPMHLEAGQSIVVWVGPAGDGYGDTTPVTFTITATEQP